MNKQIQQTQLEPTTNIQNIPDGFTVGIGPDGQQYLVPQYLVPALDQAFASYRSKEVLGVFNAPGGSSQVQSRPYNILGEGKILFPPDPDLSDHESLNLHAEVIALQHKLGISYKDASHRLYIAEVEKLKVLDTTCKAFNNLDKHIESLLTSRNQRFGDAEHDAEHNATSAPNADADADITREH